MEKDLKRALYIGRIGLPDNAPSIRVYNNSCILHKLGYTVDILCLKESETVNSRIIYSDWLRYYFVDAKKLSASNFFKKIGNIIELIFNIKSTRRIKKQILVSKPNIVILYNDLLFSSIYLKRYCRRKGIKLISDVTEWYEKRPFQKNIGKYLLPILTDRRIRYADEKIGNIIAISPYLRDYYLAKRCNVLFLPPVFEAQLNAPIIKHDYYNQHVVNFIYAGSPGNKDILLPFINAVVKINRHLIKIRLDILGFDRSYFSTNDVSVVGSENSGIFYHGKVKHDVVLDFLKKADFTVLLRNNQRYAKAGFSTKLAESMLTGVAMFANRVGGAESIMADGVDGIIINTTDEGDIERGLYKVLDMSVQQLLDMRKKAAEKASNLFVGERYIEQFRNFIDRI